MLASGGVDGVVSIWDAAADCFAPSESVLCVPAGSEDSARLAHVDEAQGRCLDSIYSLAWCPKDNWSCGALR